ncbi:MAG: YcaO-like family protein [Candidatus Absconditabacterales bacterium]|nr:YcaO-like family protein [Candidatus Absconditabacterales bacterium]
MIIVDTTHNIIYTKKSDSFVKITGDFEKIYAVIQKKYTQIEEKLPDYINFMATKNHGDINKDIIIASYIHNKIFHISRGLVKQIGIQSLMLYLFCMDEKKYVLIKNNPKCSIYFSFDIINETIIIDSLDDVLFHSLLVGSKKIGNYWKGFCQTPLGTSILQENRYNDFLEATGSGLAKTQEIAIEKAKSESLERMVAGYCGKTSLFDHNKIHQNTLDLFFGKGFDYKKLDIDWFEGYSLFSQKKYLFPGNILFYPYYHNAHWNANSNGMACHITHDDAIENALHELIERDAFALFWLCKSRGKKIIPNNIIMKMIQEQTYEDYETHLFLLTYDHPIPVVLTVIKRNQSIVCSMGTGYTLMSAIQRSLEESGQFAVEHLNYSSNQKDDDLIVEMHIKHYLKSENFKEVAWIFDIDLITIEEGEKQYNCSTMSELLLFYQNKGYDIFCYDYNAKILEIHKRYCVRIMTNALIPFWFGNKTFQPIHQSDRIIEALKKIGKNETNKSIHPFG